MKRLSIFASLAFLAYGASAQDISGTIQVSRKLTKRSVTAAIPVYSRGTAVKLGNEADADPMAYERARVVVYLEGAGSAEGEAKRAGKFSIEQQNRQFLPDILAVPAGATVNFPNMDPIFHNIFSLSRPKEFDLGSYNKGDSRSVTFNKPGVVSVYCHLHPNMSATIIVTPNKWYAQSDREGHFKIASVPPGHYTIVAWHKSAGFFRKPIVIEAGHDLVQDFNVPIADQQDSHVEKTMQMGGHGR